MKITVCQLPDKEKAFKKTWKKLILHLQEEQSDFVLLNEMPFSAWMADEKVVQKDKQIAAVEKHEKWLTRIGDLNTKIVAYSKPVFKGDKFHNTAFVWTKESGHVKVHSKYFFPEEAGFWEESWFDKDQPDFQVVTVSGVKIGFLLCTEIWFTEYARNYAKDGIDLLLIPRATGKTSIKQWLRCGQTLAIISGAYCLSSNRSGKGKGDFQWSGTGWIAQPMNGELLGKTSTRSPFLTLEIDLEKTKIAKSDYPINVEGYSPTKI